MATVVIERGAIDLGGGTPTLFLHRELELDCLLVILRRARRLASRKESLPTNPPRRELEATPFGIGRVAGGDFDKGEASALGGRASGEGTNASVGVSAS